MVLPARASATEARSAPDARSCPEAAGPLLLRKPYFGSQWLSHGCLKVPTLSQLPYGKALYSYEGKEPGDLKFNKGDVILLRRRVDEHWYHGELQGARGFLPASYIQCVRPWPQALPQGKALYDFEMKDRDQDKDCLTFTKDEVLTVIRRVDDNWAEGMLGDKIGIFPLLYVEGCGLCRAQPHTIACGALVQPQHCLRCSETDF
ncbi:PREDICTED: SH3 domain-containing RING finger protein 3-like [Ceratotherium simum simum]|uniref:SH3 domain-containing RING finger protein 3-like n=1 Tax=Ceratotherium simum simum TaxID=73337 RepID=A0ABM1D5J5_CERSS|nr:PREDICTED: SH3 domain-containing RING finger protein 3-like [Ceratotherium simum simum]